MKRSAFQAFGHGFSEHIRPWVDDLRALEREGATYQQWILDDEDGGPGLYRVRFDPVEVHRFVRGLVAWDEFLDGGWGAVTDRELAREAMETARLRCEQEKGRRPGSACPADFLGDDVEGLVCGWRLDRAERVRPDWSARDVVALLHEMVSSLPIALRALPNRKGAGIVIDIRSEQDLQDVLFLILRSLFGDARREEWTPSAAGGAKRIDIALPSARVLVEVKFVRDPRHARRVADELRIDIESYHSHPACGTVLAVIWDPNGHLLDPQQLERDLTGSRTKSGSSFDVAVRVVG